MSITAKICGLSTEAAVRAAVNGGAKFVGFIHFPRSPRHISLKDAAKLKALLPASVASVCVLVDPSDELLRDVITMLAPNYIQLHGNESLDRVREIKLRFGAKIIKAIKVSTAQDIKAAAVYYPFVDMMLFDAAPPKDSLLPGGNGIAFEWSLLQGITVPLPWLLSGGLNEENVVLACDISGATMVDVSSGVETEPGVKSPALITAFLKATGA